MTEITIEQVEKAIDVASDTVIRNEIYFSDLDGLAGDGDFGTSLATGFKVIKADLPTLDKSAIGAMLLKISMLCSKHVGGSSGPIWGTGFMKAGMASKDKTSVSLEELAAMVNAAVEGIMARGGAKLGDKTLLDALIPIAEKMKELAPAGDAAAVLKAVTEVADKAIDETRNLVAHRGRASQVGERSANTPDPGIVGVATILYDWCKHYGVDYTPTAAELNR
ncbi:dihydroxyacetone kinase subunit L [Altererythrobacter sp. CC-YST694]|uniref:dihydroxyacetone kinase subunit DhaL n=1 Tax=Altererythrobacter sp. CC-YST694 TaxID=2755038 RepID=UPI001D016485|nr:dihydroxyacetone kinase subunit DhaL [Altererythrobacter sp. CC-YST694]MCB5423857.1 dihydroxyacetone kinase subunit L [Altererythrobacter sp. CC-YST694]